MADVVMEFDTSFPDESTENELLLFFDVFVKDGLLIGSLVAIKFVIVVAKLGSLFNAIANSFNVSEVAGDDDTKFAIAVAIAVACAVETGLFTSEVLSQLPNPTFALVRLVKLAFKSKAACVAVDIGLVKSVVLSTNPSPTVDLVIPVVVPLTVKLFVVIVLSTDRFPNTFVV